MSVPLSSWIGSYRVIELLGSGGMGEVYLVEESGTGVRRALKTLRSGPQDSELWRRFMNEGRVQRELRHPNIAAFHEMFLVEDRPCLVMEYVDGETLFSRTHRLGPLPLDQALAVITHLCAALSYLHERGVMHRDLKSANIKITPGGSVKLLDFGIAKLKCAPGMTTVGTVMGTPEYLAPEQIGRMAADARSEIWALGLLAYEMLTGRLPFQVADENGLYDAIRRVAEILLWTLDGVRHAHQAGILHRDLKPANIMITPDGRVKVTDFGIARVLNTVRLTREARVVGTLEYLAPERALGRAADARSDLYSLGVVFYEMLTGRLPFQSDSDFALMKAQIEQMPMRPREIGVSLPPQIEAALMKALAKDPEDRYPDAAAFAADFREAVRATGIPLANVKPTRLAEEQQHPPKPRTQTVLRFDKRTARLAAMVAGGLIAVGAAGIGVYKAIRPTPAPVPAVTGQPTGGGGTMAGRGAGVVVGVVVPIAPSVTIPSAPPPAETPSAPPPNPAPSAPAPRPPQSKPAAPRPQALGAPVNAALENTVRLAIEQTDSGSPNNGTGPIHFAGIMRGLHAGQGAAALIARSSRRKTKRCSGTPRQATIGLSWERSAIA
jgi:serine/threonine protein kinase